MKLPIHPVPDHQPEPERVAPPWRTLVLVCGSCRADRKGPGAREIRKGIKRSLGKPKNLRVVEVDCLDVCPDHAVTVCTVRDEGPPEVHLLRTEDDLEALTRGLASHGE